MASERSPLLQPTSVSHRRVSRLQDEEAGSIIRSHVSENERKLADASVGERLPYNDYTTIDWLHDLVKESYRLRFNRGRQGLRFRFSDWFDQASGWIAAAIIGLLTACVAFLVDISEATVSDWKIGYCTNNPFLTREGCCEGKIPLPKTVYGLAEDAGPDCDDWNTWSNGYWTAFGIYLGFALAYGIVSGAVTMTTKKSLPAVDADQDDKPRGDPLPSPAAGKTMYMAAGSGIPEIKTILSGFVIPHFLDLKVLVVKAVGSVFAVATGMCLGKEGPFVHISTCVGYLVAVRFPKYRENGRKMREMLSAACASGLSVAFGAPIGGVLFSYEEISTYFPRKVLWRAFLCSLFAAATLKALNPTGTGKLVLFETNYTTTYNPVHYLIFILLGVAGGIFGGTFCRLNFLWSKWFRSFQPIKTYPVFEAFLIVLATVLLQYPNPLTRVPGDIIIKNLVIDCSDPDHTPSAIANSWVCQQESLSDQITYHLYLLYGTLTKLVLTIITFGVKVPSGVIIPSLDAGALFGRLIGNLLPATITATVSPGIFAVVGAAAFLAGVSRMTISLCVIMFELTGDLEAIVPHMMAILVAKWVADALGRESVYDLAQTVLGHPFLDPDHAMALVAGKGRRAEVLIPPKGTMEDVTVVVPAGNKVGRKVLEAKLARLRQRGLMDAGLVLIQGKSGICQGYLAQGELDFGLKEVGKLYGPDEDVRLLGGAVDEEDEDEGGFDLSHFVDRTPLTISEVAPLEYVVEMFGKLGLRHLIVVEEGTSRMVGVIIKKRLVAYLETLMEDE